MSQSAAMTTKDRKDILNGLVDQGAEVVREGPRGVILNLPNGARFTVPKGTGDTKARLAMRSQIRRAGLHWPLDPPETAKKETTMSATDTTERPLLEHQRVPGTVEAYRSSPTRRPREQTYRQVEHLLRDFAARGPFWTDAFVAEARAEGIPGYANTAGMGQGQIILDFAGFRVVESKPNRGGYSYRWARDERQPWPTEFAAVAGMALTRQQEAASNVTPITAKPAPPAHRLTPIVPAVAEEPEQSLAEEALADPNVEIVDASAPDDDDAALDLAQEYEQRALRAERARDAVQAQLETERRNHAETRRNLMVRLANQESKTNDEKREVARLRSLLEEERLLATERAESAGDAGPSSTLARLHQANERQAELERDLAAADARVLEIERGYQEIAMAAARDAAPSRVENEWWPLEPASGQTFDQLIEGAPMFGLEVRLQARRK